MAEIKIPQSKAEVRDLILEVVKTLVALLEEKDPFLKKHSERVANNCANFCEQFKILGTEDIETVYFAGLLHDIGIVAVPLDILKRSDPLSDEEMVRIKRHPVSGEKVLSNFSYLKDLLPMVRHHHEAVDGSGYPDGIEGDKIPLGARIIGLFNYFDNLVFPRFSGKALSIEAALEDVNDKGEQKFDKKLINNFMTFIEANSGKSEDYLLKKETASMRSIFTTILQKFTAGKINPPVMPQVVREVQTVVKRPKSTSEELAQVIEKDPVISLRLISVANSPIYRGVTEIRNVKGALPRLGLKETLNIILAIANKSLYSTDKVQFRILMDKLWVHSLASAYGSKLIAQNLKLDDSEKFFLMGLIHDIGKILLLKAFTEFSKDKNLNMNAITANIQEAHLSLGSLLLKRWGFDEDFINVLTHHEDKNLSPDTDKEILVVHLANMVTRKIGFSLFEDEIDLAELESAQILKMEPETIEDIGEKVKQIISDVAHLF
ncbi:MAG: HDOD domain-containing protein [Desulfobacterales bacterium]|nr:MAG: HDOD domain-containing protein [Desulfobacterales bacterium]